LNLHGKIYLNNMSKARPIRDHTITFFSSSNEFVNKMINNCLDKQKGNSIQIMIADK